MSHVIDIYTDDFQRSRWSACIYCGNTTCITRDHVISVSWTGYKRSYTKGNVVPACMECNGLLGNRILHCISLRASYLVQALSFKYKKALNHPDWDDEEIKTMSKEFQKTIIARNNLKDFIVKRINHCILTSLEAAPSMKVKEQTQDDAWFYRILMNLYFGYQIQEIAKLNNLSEKELKALIKGKKYHNIKSIFLFENRLPFTTPLVKYFAALKSKRNAA